MSTDESQKNAAETPKSEADDGSNGSNGAEEVEVIDVSGEAPDDAEELSETQQAQEEAAKLKEQLLRTAADFDNYRKRARRDVDEAERRSREDLLRELLPVFDNLERAATHAEGATEVKALADGIQMVMRQFQDTLGKLGIERVAAVGSAFDPTVHEAVQHIETPEHPPGTVAMEVQAGYKLGERLVRPAMVCVAKPPAAPSDGETSRPTEEQSSQS